MSWGVRVLASGGSLSVKGVGKWINADLSIVSCWIGGAGSQLGTRQDDPSGATR